MESKILSTSTKETGLWYEIEIKFEDSSILRFD